MSTQNDGKPLTPDQISSALKSQIDTPYVGSTYALTLSTPPTLATVIADQGYEMPVTADQVATLAKQIEQKASIPVLGNLGGGLSWPIPMSQEERKSVRSFLLSDKSGLPGLPLRATHTNGTLNYLLQGSSVTHSDLQGDPQAALQKLFDTPRAQALGQALQTHLKGVSTATSIYDYLLTAINDGLHLSGLFYPEPKKIGDIYLDSPVYWGQPPSLVAEHLSKYLIKEGLASESTAKLATHVLLASRAPHFLIKDIPPNVKVGSVLWGQFALAAAKIEAQTPGLLPNMTYAEVIAAAQSLPANNVDVQIAQRENLKEWGLASGLLPILQTTWTPIDGVQVPSTPEPTESEMERVRVAYNSRLQALMQASTGIYTPLASRKEIALNCLRTEFPNLDPAVFEAKVLSKRYTGRARAGDPRLRSMLDIVMEGKKIGEKYIWITNDRRVPIDAFNAFARSDRLHAPEVFKAQFESSVKAQKEGHHGMVKHLISQLPLDDRKNFEFGKLEYFHSDDYKGTKGNRLELVKRGHTLIVKTTRNGETNLYEIDTTKGTIKKQNDRLATLLDQRETTNEKSEKIVSVVRPYHPFSKSPAPNSAESTETPAIPDSYNSDRTNNIADFYVKCLGLDDESFLNYCKGVTSFDKDKSGDKTIGNFLLNLIPFRAAIVNLSNGRYGEAVGDLAFDIFGFVTLGAGKVAQASKALGKGLGVTRTASKVIKFLGVSTLEALNPLPTTLVGSLLTGGGKLLAKGATKSAELANMLRGASGSYDLLKAASKSQRVVAIGTYKIGEAAFEGTAVLRDGKWYAYNPVNGRAYGKPLAMFTPDSVAMGGKIEKFKMLANDAGFSVDTTKRGLRLTVDAHGAISPGDTSALIKVDGAFITPNELLEKLKSKGVKLEDYAEIRLAICHSGSGGTQSFAAQFSRLTKKPTEAFVGVMYTSAEVENIAAASYKIGGAKQQELITDTVIDTKKTITKLQPTGKTDDGRYVYTRHPDYNPVYFDAQGQPLPPKPPKAPHIPEHVVLNERRGSQAPDIDFDEYEDLT